jgi:hypothetical protein
MKGLSVDCTKDSQSVRLATVSYTLTLQIKEIKFYKIETLLLSKVR